MPSSGNGGAGAGGGMAGGEGGPAESVSMAAHGHEEAPDVGWDDIGPGSHSGLGPAQVDAIEAASVSISRNAGSRSNQVAQRDAMVEAGVPARQAGAVAVAAMQQARSAPRGSIEESFGVKPDQIAAGAVSFMAPPGFGMVIGAFDMLADAAVAAGWDVQDPSGMDYGDTPQSTGGAGGPGVDMAEPAPAASAPAPAPAAPAPAPTAPAAAQPAPAGPAAATGATATPLSAVGAASTRARRSGRTATIATSTLGVPGQATVARKTLLGA